MIIYYIYIYRELQVRYDKLGYVASIILPCVDGKELHNLK